MIQCLMDYGSLVCLPRNPICDECVINKFCVSHKKNLTNSIPNNKNIIKKFKLKRYTCAYIIINKKNEIFLKRRSSKGIEIRLTTSPSSISCPSLCMCASGRSTACRGTTSVLRTASSPPVAAAGP